MKYFEFDLIFKLNNPSSNPEEYLDLLFENGCDDATIGVGQMGMLSLSFSREAECAKEAIDSAISNVQDAINDVVLVEATPDFVTTTDIALLIGCTRQNIRKIFNDINSSKPTPIHIGSPSLFHLTDVLGWLKSTGRLEFSSINDSLFEISETTRKVNLENQLKNISVY